MADFMDLRDGTLQEDQEVIEQSRPQESEIEWKDYWRGFNAFYLKSEFPELRMDSEDYFAPSLDTQDETFKHLISISSPDTQKAMMESLSNEHATKVYATRTLQEQALTGIADDGIAANLIFGAVPALATPTTLLPAGSAYKAYKTTATINKIMNIGKMGLTAGAMGAAANVTDEALMGLQGLQTDYMSAGMYGFFVGAGIGGTVGAIIGGARGKAGAEVMHKDSDTYTADFQVDPDITLKWSEDGKVPMITLDNQGVLASKTRLQAQGSTTTERQNALLTDKIPFLSDFLNSDVAKAYMHKSEVGRAYMTKLIAPTTALMDKAGNFVGLGRTAADFKSTQKGVSNRKVMGITESYSMARNEGWFKGSRDDFTEIASDTYNEAVNRQSRELGEHLNMKMNQFDNTYGNANIRYADDMARDAVEKGNKVDEIPVDKMDELGQKYYEMNRQKAYDEAVKEFYDGYKIEFRHKSKAVQKAAETYRKFFKEHLETNKKLQMSGTKSTHNNELYTPRLSNWDVVKREKDFAEKFTKDSYKALRNHPTNADLSNQEVYLLAKQYVESQLDIKNKFNFTHGEFTAPTLAGEGRMIERKYYMDDTFMKEYRVSNIDELSDRYHYQMSGRQSVHFAFGTDKVDEIMDNIKNEMWQKEGSKLTDQEFNDMQKYLRNTILDLSGQLRMNALSDAPAWQITRVAQLYNSSRLGGGFGGNQFIELAATMFMSHFPSMLAGRTGKSFKQAGKLLYKKDADTDAFNQYMINSGFMQDALHNARINRFADTEAGWNSGGIEKGLTWFTDKMYKYNGMRYFKSVMEDMVGGAQLSEISMLAKKTSYSDGELARISRWGLDEKSLKELASDIDKYYDPKANKFELENFSTLNRDRMQLAVQRGIESIVVQGDSLHLPTWMKVPHPVRVLLTQFMRFPMITHNTLLRRGMSEEQARMGAAVLASIVTFQGMKYLREQSAISMGLMDERDAKFDYFDEHNGEENMMRGTMQAFNYIAPLGMLTTGANVMSTTFGGSSIGSDYDGMTKPDAALGVTGSLIFDAMSLAQEIGAGDEMTDERAALKAKALIPGFSLPIVNEALTKGIEDYY